MLSGFKKLKKSANLTEKITTVALTHHRTHVLGHLAYCCTSPKQQKPMATAGSNNKTSLSVSVFSRLLLKALHDTAIIR